jgi:hypothetical protein
LLKLRYSISEAFNREVHFFNVGTEFCPRAVSKRQNGGVLIAEKLQVFNMGFVIWAHGCETMEVYYLHGETNIVSIQVGERMA